MRTAWIAQRMIEHHGVPWSTSKDSPQRQEQLTALTSCRLSVCLSVCILS